ncbi:ABC transporter ATP-binding protein [Actinoplanes sp. GCM10030250]|uniref:ABC transporter ATP-binding protein n=1 Tax=Actinoplanes sp. GCM10030250 TaxID=3273376 RepID=UPI003622C6E8
MTAVLHLDRVGRVHPGPPAVTALHDATLVVERGDYLAVVGPSGSGKSTLLNLLGLLDRPTSGVYRLDGIDVAGLSERDRTALRGGRIGFVFQSFHLLAHRTAVENVMLAQVYNGAPRRDRRRLALTALGRVGVGHRAFAMPTTMSGGERQRVAIARALVNEPAILLCDEPTGNLDSATSQRLMELFDELHAAGLTIVVITHDAAVAGRARRLVRIVDGTLISDGTPIAAVP